MPKIFGTERVCEAIGRWSPSDLAFITEFHYSQELDGKWSILITCLFQNSENHTSWPSVDDDFCHVQIHFSRVSNFNIKNVTSNPIQITGFDIIDISIDGCENTNFSIVDYENERISFFCENVRIYSINGDIV
jgi:hypothetical protein